mgnify:CR=1 FL=1
MLTRFFLQTIVVYLFIYSFFMRYFLECTPIMPFQINLKAATIAGLSLVRIRVLPILYDAHVCIYLVAPEGHISPQGLTLPRGHPQDTNPVNRLSPICLAWHDFLPVQIHDRAWRLDLRIYCNKRWILLICIIFCQTT